MTSKIFYFMAIAAIGTLLSSFELPKKWFAAGSEPQDYNMGIDPASGQDGKNAATIQSKVKKAKGFGTLMQNCQPGKFKGKRVRMSGLLKTKDVADWAGLWLRIDGDGSKTLGFDNMHDGKTNRSVSGTTEWTKYEIVLDVPESATQLAYGALLVGKGQIWFDKISFEIVDKTVETTGLDEDTSNGNSEPVNLDFEE